MNIIGLLLATVIFFLILVPLVILRFIGGLFGGRRKQNEYPDPSPKNRPPGGRDGDVFVSDSTPDRQEKIIDDSVGQYVDYEEVEEK